MAEKADNSEKGAEKKPGQREEVHGHNTREYFRRLRFRLELGLIIAFMTPLAALSIYFHIQFNFSLKETGKLHLAALAESQRNTIELFLQERLVNIFSIFHSTEFSLSPTRRDMDHYLQNMRQVSDAFMDVGFFDAKGTQIGYAGPYPFLRGKDYSKEKWFTTLIEHDRNYYISDIYLGFRNKPHFTIAVKQLIDGKSYIIRATMDPDKFYIFMRTMIRGKGVDSALINNDGYYQIVDPERGELFTRAEYMPSRQKDSGVEEVTTGDDSILVAYAWLKETPWVLVVRQPLSIAYAQMYRTRNIMIASTLLIVVVIAGLIWFITNRLLKQAEETAEAREELRYQLIHASKLASVGELAAGVAHEINNPLAIISAESGIIRDLFDPSFNLDPSRENIIKELDVIDGEVFRAKGITHKLLNFARKSEPKLALCRINQLLDEAVTGLKEREFTVSNIKLVRDYDLNLPKTMVDPDQMKQVFLNLINNAGDAISGPGKITLSTHSEGDNIYITVTDTGCGMTPDQLKNIFLPFYTTKEVGKGTGLGLSVSLSIVESMGGRIEVQSVPGAGSSFTVVLPVNKPGEAGNGTG